MPSLAASRRNWESQLSNPPPLEPQLAATAGEDSASSSAQMAPRSEMRAPGDRVAKFLIMDAPVIAFGGLSRCRESPMYHAREPEGQIAVGLEAGLGV
jgi:hypothetical protein